MWRLGTVESDGRQPHSAAPASPQAEPAATPDTGPASARPAGGLRLATLLLLFGASLVVPTLVATGLLLEREARTEAEQLERRVEQVAGDLADDIDRQLELMAATLGVLAGSPQLATGELQAFHDRAAATLHPLGLQLLYRGLDGQQLLNTRVPWGTPLPRRQLPEIDDAVRTTLKPHYSDMLVGAVAQRPVVTLTVPVLIEGALRGFLHMSIDSERLLAILKGHSAWRCTSSRPMPPSMAACPARKAPCRSPGVSIRTPTARLIVEDEPLIAWSLADMIRTLGYEVSGTVATESAAVEGASGCGAVLMDFRLADGGSGLAAARKIRESADMPIVFCTAYAEESGLAAQMLAVRHAALVPKPVSRAKLEQAFAQLFASG